MEMRWRLWRLLPLLCLLLRVALAQTDASGASSHGGLSLGSSEDDDKSLLAHTLPPVDGADRHDDVSLWTIDRPHAVASLLGENVARLFTDMQLTGREGHEIEHVLRPNISGIYRGTWERDPTDDWEPVLDSLASKDTLAQGAGSTLAVAGMSPSSLAGVSKRPEELPIGAINASLPIGSVFSQSLTGTLTFFIRANHSVSHGLVSFYGNMRIRTYSDLSPLIGVVGYHVPSLGLIYLVAEELRMPSVEVLNWLPYLASSEATREAMLNHRSTLALDMVVPTPTPPTDPYDRLFDEPTPSPSEPTDRTPQNETIRLRAWPVRSSNDTGSQSESEDSAEAPAWPCAFLGVLVLEEELITWNQMEDIEKELSHPRGSFVAELPVRLHGVLVSPNCNIHVSVKATGTRDLDFGSHAILFACLVIASTVVSMWATVQQVRYLTSTLQLAKISFVSVSMQLILDLCLGARILTRVNESTPLLALAAFVHIVFVYFLTSRYWVAIFHLERVGLRPDEQLAIPLAVVFFFSLCVPGIIMNVDFRVRLVLLLQNLYWVPQIVRNFAKSSRKVMRRSYYVVISMSRLAIPLYTFLAPQNIFLSPPSGAFSLLLVAVVFAQVVILLLQERFGARFCLCGLGSVVAIGNHYEYRRVGTHVLNGDIEANIPSGEVPPRETQCVICMADVDVRETYMQTPCGHIFHEPCLTEWMYVKLECPSCRRRLPLP